MRRICRSFLQSLTALASLALLLAGGWRASADTPPAYHIVDLGTLGGAQSLGLAINASGAVVGEADTTNGHRHAFRVQPDLPHSDAPDLTGPTFGDRDSGAFGINAYWEAVGFVSTAGDNTHAFLRRRDGATLDLGTLPGGTSSEAIAINDGGQVVGDSDTAGGETHAFAWTASQGFLDLGTLGGGFSEATWLNNAGQVVGDSDTAAGQTHAFLLNAISGARPLPRDLGTLGGNTSYAYGINDAGQVAGSAATSSGQTHAFRWTGGVMRDLGTLPGGSSSEAFAINNAGQVVGQASDANGRTHAFFYSDATGLVDLNSRIDYPPEESWELVAASGINDAGWISGWGVHNRQTRAFLLKPIGGGAPPPPPPGSDFHRVFQEVGIGALPFPATRFAVFRPSSAEWIVRNIDGSSSSVQFGIAGDQPVPANYLDQPGLTNLPDTDLAQIAVFRPGTAEWLVRGDRGGTGLTARYGQPGDLPVPADYLGLGRAQIAVFRPGTGEWFVRKDDGSTGLYARFGQAGDQPVPGHYLLGTGKAQIAVFRPGTGEWFIRKDDGSVLPSIRFGQFGDVAVPADYLGTVGHQVQIAVFRPGAGTVSGQWFIRKAVNDATTVGPISFGAPGDQPVPGPYSGGTHVQIGVFRPSTQEWFFHSLDDKTSLRIPFPGGKAGDQPVPAAYPFRFGQ